MAKKAKTATKRKSPHEQREHERRVERDMLRRGRDHQRRVTMLARSLQRATETATVWKVRTARSLVEGTDYVVVGADELSRLQARLDDALKDIDALVEENKELSLPASQPVAGP